MAAVHVLQGTESPQVADLDESIMGTDSFALLNICVAAILLSGLLACSAVFAWRLGTLAWQRKHWSQRRKRLASIHCLMLAAAVVGAASFLIPNAWKLAGHCHFFGPLIDWFGSVTVHCTHCGSPSIAAALDFQVN